MASLPPVLTTRSRVAERRGAPANEHFALIDQDLDAHELADYLMHNEIRDQLSAIRASQQWISRMLITALCSSAELIVAGIVTGHVIHP